MAGLKKKFGEKALGYNKIMGECLAEVPPFPIFVAGILGLATGSLTMLSTDALKPLEDQPQMGQEIAIQQHTEALNTLEEQRNAFVQAQSASHYTPESLSSLITLSDEDKNNTGDAIATEEQYNDLLTAFVTAVHVDKRLNEVDAQNLISNFENTHGQVEDVTDFKYGIDVNDLMEARAQVEQYQDLTEKERAEAINAQAASANDWETFVTVGGGTAGFPFVASILILMFGGTLKRWRDDKPKPKHNTGKFNH